MTDTTQIKKWRLAHQGIEITDEALATIAPFPSLFASDLAVYLEARGQSDDVVQLVRDLNREIVWAYGNWEKSQRDNNAEKLLIDIINSAQGGGEYAFTLKFLRDYATANNIKVGPAVTKEKPAWLDGLSEMAAAPAAPAPAPAPLHPAYGQTAAPQAPPQVPASPSGSDDADKIPDGTR